MKQIVKPIDGVLHLIAYDQRGRELWSMRQSNQIVNGAYKIAAEALAGLPNAVISKVAAGTNGTAPTEGDTSITAPTIVDIQTVEYPAPDTVRFNFTFGYMDGVGKSIAEFGLLAADGRLFARKVRQPIEKTEYMIIKGSWEITGAMSLPNTPSGSPLHDLFVAAGAVWNPNTRFWEYKDLKDITTGQMVEIYNISIGRFSSSDLYCAFQGANIRTNLYRLPQLGAIYGTFINAASAFASSTIEIANLGQACYPENMSGMFSNAASLRKINGYLYVNNLKSEDSLRNAFAGTTKLEEIRLRGLRFNISFADSPLISLVSMQHLIANAANTSTITVIVHPSVYAKLTDPKQSDWYAVNTAAQAKQISFATA